MNWERKTVLVTGAGGFIGSHLTERLTELGARTRAFVEYNSTGSWGWLDCSPLNKQMEVVEWMRSHCRIDLHDAVGFDLREHVEARLREDPSSVNARRDHWDIPQCTPLHWAAWTELEDVDGRHSHDLAKRAELVTLLLDNGADPNVVSGNGYTPLDVADAAPRGGTIVALLEQRGGKRAKDLASGQP